MSITDYKLPIEANRYANALIVTTLDLEYSEGKYDYRVLDDLKQEVLKMGYPKVIEDRLIGKVDYCFSTILKYNHLVTKKDITLKEAYNVLEVFLNLFIDDCDKAQNTYFKFMSSPSKMDIAPQLNLCVLECAEFIINNYFVKNKSTNGLNIKSCKDNFIFVDEDVLSVNDWTLMRLFNEYYPFKLNVLGVLNMFRDLFIESVRDDALSNLNNGLITK